MIVDYIIWYYIILYYMIRLYYIVLLIKCKKPNIYALKSYIA